MIVDRLERPTFAVIRGSDRTRVDDYLLDDIAGDKLRAG